MAKPEVSEKITLRQDQRRSSIERFLALEKFGFENDTDLIRLFISRDYKRSNREINP